MASTGPFSVLLSLVFVVCVAAQGGSFGQPANPLDVPPPPGIATLPAKWPESWGAPPGSNTGAAPGGNRNRRETADAKLSTQPANRPVIKPETKPGTPLLNKPASPPSFSGNRQSLTKPAPLPSHQSRPTRDSNAGQQKPQPLPAISNTQKPQTIPAQTGAVGNRPGLTKPAPIPAQIKPTYTNTQKPQTPPAQTGLNGNRQGLTKPAPLPAHQRPAREVEDLQKPQVLPALVGTQKPVPLPAPVDYQKPQILPGIVDHERPQILPAPVGTHRPQTIPAYVGTVKPQPLPAYIGTNEPLVLVDPIPDYLKKPTPIADRPVRETYSLSTQTGEDKPQTLPALVSPQKPQTLPPISTQPVLSGNRESLIRPAPIPERIVPA